MSLILRIVPTFLAYLLLAAHFLRSGAFFYVVLVMAIPGLLVVRRWWARMLVQLGLGFGCAVWVVTTLTFVMARQQREMPWLRLAIILGAVALLNLIAAALLQSRPVRDWTVKRSTERAAPQ